MAKLITYDSLNNKMVFNIDAGNIQNIVTGSTSGVHYTYGGCTVGTSSVNWGCGTYFQPFDAGFPYLKPFEPFKMGTQYDYYSMNGFTVTSLLSKGWLTVGTSKYFYLNAEKTDYIEVLVDNETTNTWGHKVYSRTKIVCRVNNMNYTFYDQIGGKVFDTGFIYAKYNGITGLFAFQCEESTNNGNQVRTAFIDVDPSRNQARLNLANYTAPVNPIPIDPDESLPIGGYPSIGDLEGDEIESPDAPDETISGAMANGFLNIYAPSANQLKSFGSMLWTNAFNVKWYDIDSVANLVMNAVSDPINFIVGLFMIPVTPDTTSSNGIYLGGINCNTVHAPRVTTQFKTIDFGTMAIEELYGNYLDYSNSRLSIYLPYIGTADIDIQEVNGGTINLKYTIDCFTGACVANVECKKSTETPWGTVYNNSTVHSYSGNVAIQLPISAGSFDTMMNGLVNIGLGLGTNTPAVAMQGGKDVIQGFTGDVTTRGSLSSNTGKLCFQTPYLMFTRPIESRPANLGHLHGYGAGIGGSLKSFSGYVECSDVNLSGVCATDEELSIIESLLKGGVYV